MTTRLAAKGVIDDIKKSTAALIEAANARGVAPTLAIVRVGERPDDLSYERMAVKRADEMGIAVKSVVLDAAVAEDELARVIESVNADNSIHGCLLFRPLPEGIDETRICNLLASEKDIDGISKASLAGVFTGEHGVFAPSTAQACLEIIDHYGIQLEGKHVVVVGRSLVVGKPLAMMLLARNASVTVCHSKTDDLASLTRLADIVVCATGRARAYGPEYFTAGQTVLDVGINFDAEGKLCGDVDFAAVEPVVGAITPVPGGVGSVTTLVTLAHTARAASERG